MSVVILGLGSELQGDEAIGLQVARSLAANPPAHVSVYEAGAADFDLLSVLESASTVIAVDAIDAGAKPGTILRFEFDPADSVAPRAPLHDFDLPTLMRALPPGRRPRVLVVGLQPSVVGVGASLSPAVAASLGQLVKVVREMAGEEAANSKFKIRN